MLSGEGNAGEWWKTTVGLISKKSNFACAAHFFCTTTWNFQKLLSYTFYGGNVVRVLVHFFFTLHWCPLAFPISPPSFELVDPNGRWYSLVCQFHHQILVLIDEFRWWKNNHCSYTVVTAAESHQVWEEGSTHRGCNLKIAGCRLEFEKELNVLNRS